jgi:hypothetical protein
MQQTLDPDKMLQNQLIAHIELDSRFSVRAFSIQIRTELAFGTYTVTSCLAQSAYLALLWILYT